VCGDAVGLALQPPPTMPAVVERCATAKWVAEFHYLRSIATGPLAEFLDYITCVPRC
jgi:hypothetical protein